MIHVIAVITAQAGQRARLLEAFIAAETLQSFRQDNISHED